jgi:hypothetical protein
VSGYVSHAYWVEGQAAASGIGQITRALPRDTGIEPVTSGLRGQSVPVVSSCVAKRICMTLLAAVGAVLAQREVSPDGSCVSESPNQVDWTFGLAGPAFPGATRPCSVSSSAIRRTSSERECISSFR